MIEQQFLIVDGHLDLAFNAVQAKRDLTQSADSVRVHDTEAIRKCFGTCTVTLPELRRGNVGIVFATVMTRVDPNDDLTRTGMYCQSQCYAVGRGHAAYYQALEMEGQVRIIHTIEDLDGVLAAWQNPDPTTPPGIVLAMEAADSIVSPDMVPEWYQRGLRMVGIAHFGKNAYSHGTGTEGGLLPRAKNLVQALEEAGIILDMTHFTDRAFWELLEIYNGPVAASHHNCRALVPGQRQLADNMIRAIAERGGVIGAAFDAWMLDPNWDRGKPAFRQQTRATLETIADHIDHVSQLLGNSLHSGIGSDLDGLFGTEQAPKDLNTIADLQNLRFIFEHRGYSEHDMRNIFSENWIRLLRKAL